VRFDRKTCESDAAPLAVKGFSNDREDPEAVYDAAIGAECLEAIEANVVCGQLDDSNGVLAACDALFHGEVAAGEPCESSAQCRRERGQSATCGELRRCTVYARRQATHGKLGDACAATCISSECIVEIDAETASIDAKRSVVECFRDDGLYCDTECKELAAIGEPCPGEHEACADDAYCDLSDGTGIEGTCAARLANGADCSDSPGACRSRYCDEDTFICGERPGLSEAECSRPF
jgi:hypothetical protein